MEELSAGQALSEKQRALVGGGGPLSSVSRAFSMSVRWRPGFPREKLRVHYTGTDSQASLRRAKLSVIPI